ncbi:hypothetical protein NHX12_026253, partial [Muraenolepis orangiensis]
CYAKTRQTFSAKRIIHLLSLTFSLNIAMASRLTLVLLCLTSLWPCALACPPLCKCYARRAEVVCSEVPLTEFPSEGLPADTTMLTIQLTNITTVSERHLNATPLLEGLHLYSNHLQSLPSDLLRGVPRLHTLDLTGNRLVDLPAGVFHHAPLLTLVLKNNRLERVDTEWLSGDSGLTWLDLSGNRLTAIPPGLFKKLPRLESLDISHNRLEKIPAKSLDTLTKLERLNLQKNKLVSLDPLLFHSMTNLTNLYLTDNRLNMLPPSLFQSLGKLKILGLEENQLGHIPPGLLDPLSSLDEEGLDLTGNPWLCNYKTEHLWRWLQKNKGKVFLPEAIRCAKPNPLAGRSVLSFGVNILLGSLLALVDYDYGWRLGVLASLCCPSHCECSLSVWSTGVVCSQSDLSLFPVEGLPITARLTTSSPLNLSVRCGRRPERRAGPGVYLQLYHSNLETLSGRTSSKAFHSSTPWTSLGNRLACLPPNHALHHGPLLQRYCFRTCPT